MPQADADDLGSMGEQGWLRRVRNKFASLPSSDILVPIGDDAVVLTQGGGQCLILTTDAQMEGTHFRRDWLGWRGWAARSLLAAASDITAMGGIPTGFALSFGAPGDVRASDLDALLEGFADTAREYGLAALGGDTVRSERIFADIIVLGSVREECILRQTGAQPGDALWITGTLGAGFARLLDPGAIHLDDPLWRPPARWPILAALREAFAIRALTDLSDGLARDLDKILPGGLGASIDLETIPLAASVATDAARHGVAAWECGYLGGEDFELLVVEQGNQQESGTIDLGGVPLTRIGQVLPEGSGVHLHLDGREAIPKARPFDHFE